MISAGAAARSKCGGGPECAVASIFRPTPFLFGTFLLGEQKKKWIGKVNLSSYDNRIKCTQNLDSVDPPSSGGHRSSLIGFQFPFDLVKINSTFTTPRCAAGFGGETFVDDEYQIRYCTREDCDKKDLLENHVPKISIQIQYKETEELIQFSTKF